ncbi:MAG TPA: ABC transporter permease [Thermomicrobiales bacterium]|nr:ABC transporter permease [Thermomicrobiales bacterium]
MRSFIAMVRANVKMSFRNRNALFWNLAFPALFILIFGAVFARGPGISIRTGIVGPESAFRSEVTSTLRDAGAFALHTGDEQAELRALSQGDRDVVIVFGAPSGGNPPPVTLYYDQAAGPTGQIGVGTIRQILTTVAGGASPIDITETPVQAEPITFMDAFVPGILAMSLMNAGIIGISTAFVSYRERGILRRIKMTPFPLTGFILARIVSQLVVVLAQAAILIGLSAALFGLHVRGNWLEIALTVLIASLAFLAIGFAISSISRNVESAASYANLVTFPMLFLSGVFFSMDSAPGWLQPITNLLPLAYAVDALRSLMTRGNGLGTILLDLAALLITFVVAMVIAVRFFRWDARPT